MIKITLSNLVVILRVTVVIVNKSFDDLALFLHHFTKIQIVKNVLIKDAILYLTGLSRQEPAIFFIFSHSILEKGQRRREIWPGLGIPPQMTQNDSLFLGGNGQMKLRQVRILHMLINNDLSLFEVPKMNETPSSKIATISHPKVVVGMEILPLLKAFIGIVFIKYLHFLGPIFLLNIINPS